MLELYNLYVFFFLRGGFGRDVPLFCTVDRHLALLLPTQKVTRLPLSCPPKSDQCQKHSMNTVTRDIRVVYEFTNKMANLAYRIGNFLLDNNPYRSPYMIFFIQMFDPTVGCES
jgi:hypothetical protein